MTYILVNDIFFSMGASQKVVTTEKLSGSNQDLMASSIRLEELNNIKKIIVESLLPLADAVDRINNEIKKITT